MHNLEMHLETRLNVCFPCLKSKNLNPKVKDFLHIFNLKVHGHCSFFVVHNFIRKRNILDQLFMRSHRETIFNNEAENKGIGDERFNGRQLGQNIRQICIRKLQIAY